jgi:hypothetical protein
MMNPSRTLHSLRYGRPHLSERFLSAAMLRFSLWQERRTFPDFADMFGVGSHAP